jgi:hypothetical protein
MEKISDANYKALHGMNLIQAHTDLTETGKLGLIQIINPFADFQMAKMGYYDSCESSSIVKRLNYSTAITVPASVASGANWDAHIFTTPFLNVTQPLVTAILAGGNILSTTGDVNKNLGGVTVMTAPAGGLKNITACVPDLNMTLNGNGLNPVVQINNTTPSDLDDCVRLIGMGFEVHNVTNKLSAQGTCTVWREANILRNDTRVVNQGTVSAGTIYAPTAINDVGAHQIVSMMDIPYGTQQALLLQGSQQWEAIEGCMVVPTLNDQAISPQKLSSCMPVVRAGITTASGSGSGAGQTGVWTLKVEDAVIAQVSAEIDMNIKTLVPASGQTRKQIDTLQHVTSFNSSGAMFTGLSYASVLQVNTIFYLEIFPSVINPLVTLASPSPPYDPVAMTIYSNIMNKLPIGVKVADNADGDWFFETVQWATEFLKPAIKNLPGGGILSTVSDMANKWAGDKLEERNPGKKTVKKTKPNPLNQPAKKVLPAPGAGNSKKAKARRARNNAASKPRQKVPSGYGYGNGWNDKGGGGAASSNLGAKRK